MTTFQDPQPHSRRAARESERAARAAEGFDSELPPDFDDSEVRASGSGRRVRTDANADTGSFVPPHYDSSPFQVTAPEPGPSSAQFRPRDSSPEGRRSAGQASSVAPLSVPLDYAAQQNGERGLEHPADQLVPTAEPASDLPPLDDLPMIPASEPTRWPFAPVSSRSTTAEPLAAPASEPSDVAPDSEWGPPSDAVSAAPEPVPAGPEQDFRDRSERTDFPAQGVQAHVSSDQAVSEGSAPEPTGTEPVEAELVDAESVDAEAAELAHTEAEPDGDTPAEAGPADSTAAAAERAAGHSVESFDAILDARETATEEAPVPQVVSMPEQRFLTRRERRRLEAQASAAEPEPLDTSAPTPLVEPAAQETSPEALSEAVTDIPGFEAFLRPRPAAASAPSVLQQPEFTEAPEVDRAPQPWPAFASAVHPVEDAERAAHDDVDLDVDTVLESPSTPAFAEPPVQRESYTPPRGHWSRQADLDDETQPYENTLSRDVGGAGAPTTTSALILPSIPQSDFASVINGTGEILITGSINLPRGFGTTGADHRNLDDSNVDKMFEASDGEMVSNDSQPVRAIRAISTHTSTQGVIVQPRKQRGNRLLTAGIITAVVLAVGVVGLLAYYIVKIT